MTNGRLVELFMTLMFHTVTAAMLWMQATVADPDAGVEVPLEVLIDAIINFVDNMTTPPRAITIVMFGCMMTQTLVNDLLTRLPRT